MDADTTARSGRLLPSLFPTRNRHAQVLRDLLPDRLDLFARAGAVVLSRRYDVLIDGSVP